MASTRLGEAEPRLATPPLRTLSPSTSLGYRCIAWNRLHGLRLLPWQERFLIHALEVKPGGGFRFATVLLLVSRQNGKTAVVKALTRWLMATRPGSMVLGVSTAQELAREPWNAVADAFLDEDVVARVTRGSIDTSLWLENGSRYKVAAANRRGGRSLSVDLLLLDELREMVDEGGWDAYNALTATTTARSDPLIVAMSNAGDDRSVVLNGLRDRALAGHDPSLGLFEWSAPDDAELDDLDATAQANPALGVLITEDRLAAKRAQMPAAGYRTEHMCQRVESLNPAVDSAAWRDCTDPGTLEAQKGRIVLGFDVSLDLSHATLVAAGVTDDGRVRVEPVAEWSSTAAALADLPEWVRKVRPRAVGWLHGPADALAPELRKLRGQHELTKVSELCQGLAEAVSARRLLHADDPLLTAQILHVSKKAVADGWRFTRLGAGNADAAYACAAAVYLARQKLAKTNRVRIVLPDAS